MQLNAGTLPGLAGLGGGFDIAVSDNIKFYKVIVSYHSKREDYLGSGVEEVAAETRSERAGGGREEPGRTARRA